jgi:LacI family transcriptional regulator
MRQTTMKRVASELGVSITTVSKVLNNQPDIGDATRTRVLAKVEELGYQRNAVARSLSLRRTHALGIVIPDVTQSFFAEVIVGIESVARHRGYGLLLCSSAEDAGQERMGLDMLRSRQADGVILAAASGAGNTDLLHQLTRQGTSLVMIDRDDHPGVKCHRVITDDEQVGVLATSHLLDLGRRTIAHIAGPSIVHAGRREKGWRAALKARGIKPQEKWLVRGGFLEADGYRSMKTLLAVRPRIDAVFAVCDPCAIGATNAILEAGLRVPDDVAIVGAGDVALGDLLRVPLTTVGWSRRDMGRHAAELLLSGLGGPDEITRRRGRPQRIIVPPHLIVRESSAAS